MKKKLSSKIKSINIIPLLLSIGYRTIFLIIALAVGVGVFKFDTYKINQLLEIEPTVWAVLLGGLAVIFSQVEYDGNKTKIEFIPWKMSFTTSILFTIFIMSSYYIVRIPSIDSPTLGFFFIMSIYLIISLKILSEDLNKSISSFTETRKIESMEYYLIIGLPIYLLPGVTISVYLSKYRFIYVSIAYVIVLYLVYHHIVLSTVAQIMKGNKITLPAYVWTSIPIISMFYIIISVILGEVPKLIELSLIVLITTLAHTIVLLHNSNWEDSEDGKTLRELTYDIISLIAGIEGDVEFVIVRSKDGEKIANITSIEKKIEKNTDEISSKRREELKRKIEAYKRKLS